MKLGSIRLLALFLLLATGVFIFSTNNLHAQQDGPLQPVKWSAELEEEDGLYLLTFNAEIEKGWYVYSQFIGDVGPVPTTFYFNDTLGENYILVGVASEDGKKVSDGMDPIWEAQIKKFGLGATFVQKVKAVQLDSLVKAEVEFMTCNDEMCLPPEVVEFTFNLKTGAVNVNGEVINEGKLDLGSNNYGRFGIPVTKCVEEETAQGFWMFLLLGMGGGFVALLTPCVFPMIPLTVSFFTKGANKTRSKGIFDASFYGVSIIFIYFLLSVPFLVFNISPDILNEFSTNPVVNMVFFAVFIIFAISFFGVFEITLPASFANRADKASDVGGLVGIFFMALTLAIVSFSCTGPILGSLLVGALTTPGGQTNLVAGMVGFGTALALPFSLFAMFPSYLNKLPKSGGWLNSVKVVLGFAEVALAIKFLSQVDTVLQWGILKRELFLGIWIVVGIGMVLYLFGLITFPHDSKPVKLSVGRKAFGVAVLAFTIYLVPGLFGVNLKLLSGFPPPMSYSFFYDPGDEHIEPIINDYDEALALAQKEDKPLLIDFTGWACVNCRQMEENVWVEPEIKKMLTEEYVLVSLYVDERTSLPEDQHYYSDFLGGNITTVGRKWKDFQGQNFKAISQPWYVIVSPEERIISNPSGATNTAGQYQDFLECGLKAFNQSRPTSLK